MSYHNPKPSSNSLNHPHLGSTEYVQNINGAEIVTGSTTRAPDNNGRYKTIHSSYLRFCPATGRLLPAGDFLGYSWTGLVIPADSFTQCLNPFGHHGFRLIYLGVDGFATELGSILCLECLDHQARMLKWNKWTLGFLNFTAF